MQNRKRGVGGGGPGNNTSSSNKNNDDDRNGGFKGHAKPRRSILRDCFLMMVAFTTPLLIMHWKKPAETDAILEEISEEAIQKLDEVEQEVLQKLDEVEQEAQKELEQQFGIKVDLPDLRGALHRDGDKEAEEGGGGGSKPDKNDSQKTIAYVVPFFWECHEENLAAYKDAAIVLKQSIHLQSSRVPTSGSEFDYQMYALTVSGYNCPHNELEALGYNVVEVEDTPVDINKIQNQYLRDNIADTTQGAHYQFIQLLAHALVQEDIFVILFINSILLQPLDDLFHAIMYPKSTTQGRIARAHIQSTKLERPNDGALPEVIDHFFVRDYPHAGWGRKPVVYRQGFLVSRRNPAVLQQAIELIHKGNYIQGNNAQSGWGGKGYNMYFRGGMTMPGFFAYLLDEFYAASSVELSGCKFNHNGMDNLYRNSPRFLPMEAKKHYGHCRSGQSECGGDCTTTDIESIYTILFDVDTCHFPWECYGEGEPGGSHETKIDTHTTTIEHCFTLQKVWHSLRRDIENEIAKAEGTDASLWSKGQFESNSFQGHCLAHNEYITMSLSREIEARLPKLLWGD